MHLLPRPSPAEGPGQRRVRAFSLGHSSVVVLAGVLVVGGAAVVGQLMEYGTTGNLVLGLIGGGAPSGTELPGDPNDPPVPTTTPFYLSKGGSFLAAPDGDARSANWRRRRRRSGNRTDVHGKEPERELRRQPDRLRYWGRHCRRRERHTPQGLLRSDR